MSRRSTAGSRGYVGDVSPGSVYASGSSSGSTVRTPEGVRVPRPTGDPTGEGYAKQYAAYVAVATPEQMAGVTPPTSPAGMVEAGLSITVMPAATPPTGGVIYGKKVAGIYTTREYVTPGLYGISGMPVSREEYYAQKAIARARAYRSGGYQLQAPHTEVSYLKKKRTAEEIAEEQRLMAGTIVISGYKKGEPIFKEESPLDIAFAPERWGAYDPSGIIKYRTWGGIKKAVFGEAGKYMSTYEKLGALSSGLGTLPIIKTIVRQHELGHFYREGILKPGEKQIKESYIKRELGAWKSGIITPSIVYKAKLTYHRAAEWMATPTGWPAKVEAYRAKQFPSEIGSYLTGKFQPIGEFAYKGFVKPLIPSTKGQIVWSGAYAGATFLLPPVGSVAGKVGQVTRVTPLLGKLPYAGKVWTGVKVVGGLTIAGLYLKPKVEAAIKQPGWGERVGVFTKAGVYEVAPMIAGAYAGGKVWPWAAGKYAVFKAKIKAKNAIGEYGGMIEARKIAETPEVGITLAKRVITAKELKYSFETGRLTPRPVKGKAYYGFAGLPGEEKGVYAWHATAKGWEKLTVLGRGEREIPGLFVAPRLQTHFLRLSDVTYKPFGFEFPTISKPRGIRLKGLGIEVLPKGIPAQRAFLETEARKGVFYLPLYKREYEAVVPAGTLVRQYGKTYFAKIKGVAVPLLKFEAVPTGRVGGVPWGVVSEEAYYKPVSLVSPYGLGIGIVKPSGYKPSEYKAVGYYPLVKYYPVGKPSYKVPGYQKITYKIPSYKVPSYPKAAGYPSGYIPTDYIPTDYIPTDYIPPPPPPVDILPPPPTGIPKWKLDVFGFKGMGRGFRKPKFKPKYTPSLMAGMFDIRGKRPKTITGLEVRPLPLIKKMIRRKRR